ncbi:MAG: ABC transporter substrate-binding protein [Proteobacteria bacterium]|nr:ABC transporter substrate-binding protein [Pseudomonadota bacterium]
MAAFKMEKLCFVLSIIIVTFLSTSLPLAIGKENNRISSSKWVWMEELPKPSWWRWDEAYFPAKPVRGGVLHEARIKYIGYMNPNHWPCNDFTSIGYMYEFLVAGGGELRPRVPWLAESWEYKNPLTVIMRLKKGIQFHDGSEFDAESLKYHIEWILDSKNNSFSRSWISPIKSLEVVDEYTIEWRFGKPWASFLPMMAYVPGYIMSAEALKSAVALRDSKKLALKARSARRKAEKAAKKVKRAEGKGAKKLEKARAKAKKALKAAARAEEKARIAAEKTKEYKALDTHPVGSGRFILEEASPGNYLKLKRNPNWWFGKSVGHPDMPYFDGVKAIVIPDPAIQLANLRAGRIDRMQLQKSQKRIAKKDPNLNIYSFPQPDTAAFLFNSAKGPCADIRVRKAVSHAIDRKAFLHGTQFGIGRIASCIFPGQHWGHNPELKPVAFEPELATKYLAEAGFKNGLVLKAITTSDEQGRMRGEVLKAMLAKVGIELKVSVLDPVALNDVYINLEYDLLAWDFQYIDEPDSAATTAFHPDLNQGRNLNEKAVALVEAGRRETDPDRRTEIYRRLEKIAYDEYLDIWLWWEEQTWAYRSRVQGWNNDMYIKGEVSYKNSHPLWFKDGKR